METIQPIKVHIGFLIQLQTSSIAASFTFTVAYFRSTNYVSHTDVILFFWKLQGIFDFIHTDETSRNKVKLGPITIIQTAGLLFLSNNPNVCSYIILFWKKYPKSREDLIEMDARLKGRWELFTQYSKYAVCYTQWMQLYSNTNEWNIPVHDDSKDGVTQMPPNHPQIPIAKWYLLNVHPPMMICISVKLFCWKSY